MSTPIIWILLPLLISGAGLLLLRYPWLLKWGGSALSLLLVLSAAVLPINQTFHLLFWDPELKDELLVFGRRFILSGADRPVVILLFALHFFWLLIFNPKDSPAHFVPFSLAGVVLILTAYAVDPIFYGALFFAFLALINVVLLSPPGSDPTPGVMRLLIYQILGMLFILFAAWLASWIDLNRGDQLMLSRSLLILALGFSFLLSIFPFISWIPMVAEANHPFLTGYLFNSYFLGVFLFGSRFITEGGWLTGGMNLQAPLQLAGVLMLAFGGVLAVTSRHLGRLSSALVIAGIGRSLLAFSLFVSGFPIYFAMVLIQAVALGVWSLSLSALKNGLVDYELDSAAGIARQWPVFCSGLLVGYLTLAGLPLLAGFPVYLALGEGLRSFAPWINTGLILGTLGLLIGGLRIFRVLVKDAGSEQVLILGDKYDRAMVITLSIILGLLGFFPQFLFRITQAITELMIGL
ncbi:MAG: hypothetical protein ACK2TT_11705 [Anaerolineales bacterium]